MVLLHMLDQLLDCELLFALRALLNFGLLLGLLKVAFYVSCELCFCWKAEVADRTYF